MNLIERQVAASEKENAINKKLVQNAYKATIDAQKFKETSRQPQKIVYGKNSLLDKIITSSLNDSATNKRLEQISVSAINGQRQSEQTYQPEGVQMLGQMGREKPLTAITKEMIKEYQDEEQAKPYMIDGEARKYMKADFEPLMQVPTPIDDIKDNIKALYKQKIATGKTIKDAEDKIKTLDYYYKALIRDINVYGMDVSKKEEKVKLEKDKINLKMEYEKLHNDLDKYDYEIKELMRIGKEINRENALISEQNKTEVAKYEQSLMQHNRNRLNIQQQPYESDMEYYKRLREIETQKVNPELYQKFALNKTTSELKNKFKNLFNNDSQIEEIIKSLNENEKFLVNKNFDAIETDFIKKNGFNPSMNSKMAVREITSFFDSPASKLQALIKRKNTQDLYIPDLSKKHEEDALDTLTAVFKRKKIEPKYLKVVNKSREMEAKKEEENAFDTLKAVFKRKKIEPKYLKIVNKSRENEANEERQKLATIRDIQQQKMNELSSQKIAKERLTSALMRSRLQPEIRSIIQDEKNEKNAKEKIASALMRSIAQPQLRKVIETQNKREAKSKTKQYMKNQEAYLRDLESRLPILENWVQYHQEQQEKEVAPQKELVKREMMMSKAVDVIKKSLQDTKNKTKIMNAVKQEITERQKPIYISSPKASSFVSASTVAEDEERLRLRYPRSDIGILRMPYKTKNNQEAASRLQSKVRRNIQKAQFNKQQEAASDIQKAVRQFQSQKLNKQIEASMRAQELAELAEMERQREARNTEEQRNPVGRPRKPRNPVGRPRKPRNPVGRPKGSTKKRMDTVEENEEEEEEEEEEEPQAKGSGIKKPTKRRDKVSLADKKKDRLRLVVSQIKAGNTNPRLIVEVNKLYKDLYEIDNAYMMLK